MPNSRQQCSARDNNLHIDYATTDYMALRAIPNQIATEFNRLTQSSSDKTELASFERLKINYALIDAACRELEATHTHVWCTALCTARKTETNKTYRAQKQLTHSHSSQS